MNDDTTTAASQDPTVGPDKDFLEIMVKAIVDKPDEVVIERSVDTMGVLIKLRVGEADMSKIVGKGGQTAKALRTLLRLVGSKFDLRSNLKILEPDGSERRAPERQAPASRPRVSAPQKENVVRQPTATATEKSAIGGQATDAFDNVI